MERLRIRRTAPVQENFLGVNAVYHGYAGMPDDAGRVYTTEQCELEADRIKALGVQVVRTYYKWWAWSRETGWNWENATMRAFYRWCERMQKRGIDIALHGGWCSPGDINGTSWGGDGPFADGNVSFETACENFAAFVSESLYQLIELRGFTNIKYLMLFTESQSGSGTMPKGYDAFSVWEKASRAIHNRLVQDKRRDLVRLIGPNENARAWNWPKALAYAAEHAADFLDSFGCHIYARWEVEQDDAIHSGKRAIFFSQPGQRIGQSVTLKPDTEYEATAYLRVFSEDYLHLSGNVLLGAFELPDVSKPQSGCAGFTAGGQPTLRFNLGSVGTFDPITHENRWMKLTHRFHSGVGGKCVLGMFYDVKNPTYAYADDFSLCEVGGGENLLKNPSFEEETSDWWGIFSTPVSLDIFDDWYLWAKTMQKLLPDGKGLWYDECNSAHKFYGYFTDPMHGTRYAMGTAALMNAGVETSLIWTAVDQQWPNNHVTNADAFDDGVQHWGMMPTLDVSLVPRPSFYAFSLMANYLGGAGTKVYAEEKSAFRLHTVLTERPDGHVTVMVVSLQPEKIKFSLDLGKATDQPLYRHVYNPKKVRPDENAAILPADRVIDANTSVITDTVPANSVILYTTVKQI